MPGRGYFNVSVEVFQTFQQQWFSTQEAGVIDEDVDAAPGVEDLALIAADIVFDGDVAEHGHRDATIALEAAAGSVGRFCADVVYRDARTIFAEHKRDT